MSRLLMSGSWLGVLAFLSHVYVGGDDMNPGIAAARFLTQSAGHGAAVGAGIGAVAGGLRTPQEGQSRLSGAIRGGLRGGVLGGAAGAVGRGYRDTRLLNPSMSAGAAVGGTLRRMGQGVSNFGKRQVYGLTGHGNPDAIGMAGHATSAKKINLHELRRNQELAVQPFEKHQGIKARASKAIADERKAGGEAQRLQDAGVTSIPGIGKALATKGRRVEAIRAMGKSLGNSPGSVALGLGLPAAMSVPSLRKGDESATGGLTVGQKVRNLGLNVASGAALGGLPFVSQMVAGTAIDAGLSRFSRNKQLRPTIQDPRAVAGSVFTPTGAPQ